jgi:hypothetical protein
MKKNCWEFNHCDTKLSCPAFSEKRLDGTHGGNNAGRCCWVVPETLCPGIPTGKYAQKFSACQQCAFYQYVKKEELLDFALDGPLLRRLRQEC